MAPSVTASASSVPGIEKVKRLVAAGSLQLEWPAFRRTLHGIARYPLRVPADKHGIVIGQGLIEVAALQACVDHFPGNAAPVR